MSHKQSIKVSKNGSLNGTPGEDGCGRPARSSRPNGVYCKRLYPTSSPWAMIYIMYFGIFRGNNDGGIARSERGARGWWGMLL